MPRTKLTDKDIQTRLAALPDWEVRDGKLHRELTFPSFIEAFAFMTAFALVAERVNHHPDWRNVYNRVVIDLWTHDAGGITARDFELAQRAHELTES
ncbi:MAG TPA: 4a-hydroxytetrahydrobiopterin dehydratase [Polyangiales bacterium]|jgi:4a-hydroxytetrahydrobiopterin dehydratase